MTGAPFVLPPGLEHLLPMYQREMQRDWEVLQQILHKPEEVAEHLHAMRGKCGLFGDDVLFDLLLALDADSNKPGSPLLSRIDSRICQIMACGGAKE